MNLALQTRRAVITLSLMALAMAGIAAKSAARTDVAVSDAPARVEAVSVREPVQVTVHIAQPAVVVKTSAARCNSKIIRI